MDRSIVLTYFAFTSLSTVGFGDYYPKNSFERICCTIILLFGNSIFGYIIGDFNGMIQEAKLQVVETDEYEELTRFFNMMENFNGNKPMSEKLKSNIERHLRFKWENDRNLAARTGGDIME